MLNEVDGNYGNVENYLNPPHKLLKKLAHISIKTRKIISNEYEAKEIYQI